MKLTSYTTVDSKTLTTPEKNLLAKLDSYGLVASDLGTISVSNWINGITVDVHPLVAALVRFIYDTSLTYEQTYQMSFNGHKLPISIHDRVKYLVLKLDNKAYSTLID
jgi:hypothetical protein